MKLIRLVWSENSELHIWSRHRVSLREAEFAAYQHRLIIRGRTEGFYNVFGQTESGRYLTVIVRNLGNGEAKLITARDMSTTERRRYERHTAHNHMAKKRKKRQMTDEEVRDYYDTHSAMPKGPLRPVKMQFVKPRVLIAMRLDDDLLDGLKKVAARKGLNYSTLARMWIAERLREEGV